MKDWLPVNLIRNFTSYSGDIYRIVEGQHFIATRKLVDSDEEQRILEEILDASKPSAPTRNKRGELHYLLYTPCRYPPLKTGGRFHTRLEQSIFYGSEDLETSMAEVAYGRFLFMHHSEAEFTSMQVPYTHFMARVKSAKSILLHSAPFKEYREAISHPTSYAVSQNVGAAMRNAGAELFTYYSARNPEGANVGLFSVETFSSNRPVPGQDVHWEVFITSGSVEFKRAHLRDNQTEAHIFPLERFCLNGAFASAGHSQSQGYWLCQSGRKPL